jgi:hypothetical protein
MNYSFCSYPKTFLACLCGLVCVFSSVTAATVEPVYSEKFSNQAAFDARSWQLFGDLALVPNLSRSGDFRVRMSMSEASRPPEAGWSFRALFKPKPFILPLVPGESYVLKITMEKDCPPEVFERSQLTIMVAGRLSDLTPENKARNPVVLGTRVSPLFDMKNKTKIVTSLEFSVPAEDFKPNHYDFTIALYAPEATGEVVYIDEIEVVKAAAPAKK